MNKKSLWIFTGIIIGLFEASIFLWLGDSNLNYSESLPIAALMFVLPILMSIPAYFNWTAFTLTFYFITIGGALSFAVVPTLLGLADQGISLYIGLPIYTASVIMALVFGIAIQMFEFMQIRTFK